MPELPEEAVEAMVESQITRLETGLSALNGASREQLRAWALDGCRADLQAAAPIIRKERDEELREGIQFEINVLRAYQHEKGGMLGKLAGEIADALTERLDSIFEEDSL